MIDLIEIMFVVAVIVFFIIMAVGYSIPKDIPVNPRHIIGDEKDRDE